MRFKRLQALPRLVKVLGIGQTLNLMLGWVLARKEIRIRVNGILTPISIRRHDSDIYVFRDDLLKRDSDPSLDAVPRFIIDGGANVGYTTLLYANKYPDATIVAVEPAAETARSSGIIAALMATFTSWRLVSGIARVRWEYEESGEIALPGRCKKFHQAPLERCKR